MVAVEVRISLKKGVADPEGANVLKTLDLLGYSGIRSVDSVKVFVIDLGTEDESEALKQAEDMCQKLLANPVIHNYTLTVV